MQRWRQQPPEAASQTYPEGQIEHRKLPAIHASMPSHPPHASSSGDTILDPSCFITSSFCFKRAHFKLQLSPDPSSHQLRQVTARHSHTGPAGGAPVSQGAVDTLCTTIRHVQPCNTSACGSKVKAKKASVNSKQHRSDSRMPHVCGSGPILHGTVFARLQAARQIAAA